jgi:putative ABC transport system ATP-binding protein
MRQLSETLLSCKNLHKSFQSNGSAVEVIRDVSLDVCAGDFTVLMGSSGSGKSTLLYLLSGLESITSGQIHFDGREISGLDEKSLALLRREGMGFVFQAFNLVPNLTLYENVLAAGYLGSSSKADVESRATELLDGMGLGELGGRLPAQVSGGEQQRAATARALINSPSILFADEPTGALNSAAGDMMLDSFTALAEGGQTIFLVTHDLRAACRGNRVIFLRDGSVHGEFTFDDDIQARERREESLFAWLSAQGW